MVRQPVLAVCFNVALLAAYSHVTVHADTLVWQGFTADFEEPFNWFPERVPGAGDVAEFSIFAGPAIVNASRQIRGLSVNQVKSIHMEGGSQLTLTGTVTNASLEIGGDSVLEISGGPVVAQQGVLLRDTTGGLPSELVVREGGSLTTPTTMVHAQAGPFFEFSHLFVETNSSASFGDTTLLNGQLTVVNNSSATSTTALLDAEGGTDPLFWTPTANVSTSATWTVTGMTTLASERTGYISIDNGGLATLDDLNVGMTDASAARVSVGNYLFGATRATLTANDLRLGVQSHDKSVDRGNGSMFVAGTLLDISQGGIVEVDDLIAGVEQDATARIEVFRSGSFFENGQLREGPAELRVAEELVIGDRGEAELLIGQGGKVVATHVTLAADEGSTAYVRVGGTAGGTELPATLDIADTLVVGESGAASLDVEGPASVVAPTLVIGRSAAASPSGPGPLGGGGETVVTGEVRLTDGATGEHEAVTLGKDAGTTGLLAVEDNSRLSVADDLVVGYEGTGTLQILGGSTVLAERLFAGSGPPSMATLLVEGNDTRLELSYVQLGNAGTANMRVADEAVVLSDDLVVFADLGAGVGTLDLDSARWVATDLMRVGDEGHGAVTVHRGAQLEIQQEGLAVAQNDGSTGQVEVRNEASLLDVTGNVEIGVSGQGSLLVEDHARAIFKAGIGEPNPEFLVAVNETGAMNGSVTVRTGATLEVADQRVLIRGGGTFRVIEGGRASLTKLDAGESINVGRNLLGDHEARMLVRDEGSTLDVNAVEFRVGVRDAAGLGFGAGRAGKGRLEVANNAVMNATVGNFLVGDGEDVGDFVPDGKVEVHSNAILDITPTGKFAVRSDGLLSVHDLGSVTISGHTRINGRANVASGATVRSANLDLSPPGEPGAGRGEIHIGDRGADPGPISTWTVEDDLVMGPNVGHIFLENNGRLDILGDIQVEQGLTPSTIQLHGGSLYVQDNTSLQLDGNQVGPIEFDEGKINFARNTTIDPALTRFLDINRERPVVGDHLDPTLRPGQTLEFEATATLDDLVAFWMEGGRLVADRFVVGDGVFRKLGGDLDVNEFVGDLVQGGGALRPGNSPGRMTIQGDYTQGSLASIEIELAGTTSEDDFDIINVTGDASLSGLLDVVLLDGYLPTPEDRFTFLTAANLSGFFRNADPAGDNIATVATDGGRFDVIYHPGSVELANFIRLTGADFDGHGDVDANDFLAWQRAFACTVGCSVDADGNGATDGNDFLAWQAAFGTRTTVPGAARASSTTVPEPHGILLVAISCLVLAARRHSGPRRTTVLLHGV